MAREARDTWESAGTTENHFPWRGAVSFKVPNAHVRWLSLCRMSCGSVPTWRKSVKSDGALSTSWRSLTEANSDRDCSRTVTFDDCTHAVRFVAASAVAIDKMSGAAVRMPWSERSAPGVVHVSEASADRHLSYA